MQDAGHIVIQYVQALEEQSRFHTTSETSGILEGRQQGNIQPELTKGSDASFNSNLPLDKPEPGSITNLGPNIEVDCFKVNLIFSRGES